MRIYVVSTALLLVSGCAHWLGPSDGLLYVTGSTPSQSPCELSVAPIGTSRSPGGRTVSGEFREEFVVNHSRTGHLAQLSCGGTVVSSRAFKYGRDVRFGGELSVPGGAP